MWFMCIFDVGHNGRGHFNIWRKGQVKKDKRSIFEIHFLFKYGYDSISSQEFHDIGISAYQLPTISR